MITNEVQVIVWQNDVLHPLNFHLLCRQFSKCTGANHLILRQGYYVYGSRFETLSSQIQKGVIISQLQLLILKGGVTLKVAQGKRG
jgi:hypothetical protein